MAAKPKKTGSKSATTGQTGAGAAAAERPKDAGKETFGKAAPKRVKAAAPAKPEKAARTAAKPSIAKRVMRKVKETASGAVELAASVVGRGSSKAKAKAK